jgi:hypothetical protein
MSKLKFTFLAFLAYFISRSQSLTYANDIAPIINSKCASCHHQGGIAPFALTSYTSVFANKNAILYDVQNDIMPPWPPDTAYSRFVGERTLTSSEKNKIINWINQGAPSGILSQAPPTPTFQSGYQLQGTPDLVIKIPVLTSSATTQDQYVCISVPSGLSQDRYIKAFEIVPGNKSIVHHVILNGDTSNQFPAGIYNNCFTNADDVGIGGYVPGQGPVVFPSTGGTKFGLRLPKNTNLVFQMHYPAGSYGQQDSTQVRFFFYQPGEPGIRTMYVIPLLQNWQLSIPANSVVTYSNTCSNSGLFANCMLPVPVSVYGAAPHSHLICKSLVNYAFNGTDTVKLIRINRWDFHWQGFYTYKKMKKVPAFYKWVSRHIYDNTSANVNNPNNPPQLVTAGENTTDEMLFDSFYLTFYQNGDENINIDSLITVSINEINGKNENSVSFKVYPNPANEVIFIENLNSNDSYEFKLYNTFGQLILRKKMNGNNTIEPIVVNNLTSGIYLLELIYEGKNIVKKFIKE